MQLAAVGDGLALAAVRIYRADLQVIGFPVASGDIEPGRGLARRYRGGIGGVVRAVDQGQFQLQGGVIHIGVLPADIQISGVGRISKQVVAVQGLVYHDVADVLVVGKLDGGRRALRAVFAHRRHFHGDNIRAKGVLHIVDTVIDTAHADTPAVAQVGVHIVLVDIVIAAQIPGQHHLFGIVGLPDL